ncbi:unnamed protein product [Mesocestoides corti]|uniref:protein-serine/threonine phosphatase n=1 Tax=Mesocestoides corti TaxID=53468 RepID=A0A158QTT1_MESCO|nr:unnamed protein product [Mesocestoides corti]
MILRFNDYIKLIVKLENASPRPVWFRYLAIVSTLSSEGAEESVIMGVDVHKGAITIGFTIPIFQDIVVTLDGDGGFKLITKNTVRLFKPISVQGLWAAHQAIMLGCKVAQQRGYHAKGPSHAWISHYAKLPASDPVMMFEWNKMEDIEDMNRATPPTAEFCNVVTEDEKRTENFKNTIRLQLQKIMAAVDLEDVNIVQLREMLEAQMGMSLKDHRHFIADQVLIIYGQMDVPSFIFDHLLLGSSFNASNGDELRRNNVTHIVNVTREVDNFFPAEHFVYKNIRVYDDEKAQLLPHWDETYKFINEARWESMQVLYIAWMIFAVYSPDRSNGTRCLVHCKMGISRSGATVAAYVMKEKGWKLEEALEFVKSKRPCVNPNANFLRQLETYQGILEASAHRHSAIFQNHAEILNSLKPADAPVSNGSSRSLPASPEEITEDYNALEPPAGPSGPVDLEAELFAFKSFPQPTQNREERVEASQTPNEYPGGLRRTVLATTSQRIRHWHPDVYEGVGNGGVVVCRSKSSPTPVFKHRQLPTTSAATSSTLQYALPIMTSAQSPLYPTTTISAPNVSVSSASSCEFSLDPAKECDQTVASPHPPASPPPESCCSSISEHDVILTPSFHPRTKIMQPQHVNSILTLLCTLANGSSEDLVQPKNPPVSFDHGCSDTTFPEPTEGDPSSSCPAIQSPAEPLQVPPAGRLTLSLVAVGPDQGQSHVPVRTLSLRLRPDDSWIVKHDQIEDGGDAQNPIAKRRPFSDVTPATAPSALPLAESSTLGAVVSACQGIQFPHHQGSLAAVIAATRH